VKTAVTEIDPESLHRRLGPFSPWRS